ncbi:aromatic-ring-hydroxylating dioxygenase [Cryobacterium glaciale]|uniref:Aromatic-ring-hydroxylating dioxygenase n=1 Tax=Cryobacterium glaciale TaxID=1259145 RepID=A0A4R8V0N0_9MICO|nr:aromatic-ring-hydroxylating dioxygenase subunit beta [Cryobacterium glaciale]TFB75418.1 aromatic-ring-hydroxylating dioxygenase [Cryobacterium glaciale]
MTIRDIDYSDTSRWSHHVDVDFYADLEHFAELFTADWAVADVNASRSAEGFLAAEARLIDEARFNDWIELFTDDCLYWVPITPGGGDPRREVSHAFDDRRRLTDRVFWLRTGLAFSQIPQSRTRRVISNVEVLDDPGTGLRLVRSNFIVHEFRAGVGKTYPGWYAHVLAPHGDGWRIRLKQANLLDSEHGHENLTLVF